MRRAQGERSEHMAGAEGAKCMLNGIGNMVVHKWSEKKKSQQSSIWLIGVIMDAVASTYQSEARGSEGEI